ncbi:hypothetical protein RhiirA1_480800 [Rhizophagus irregularis]|uniref:Uncharacterized protein n=1 Tax=Rhizophagus irregularis TaxID=588596 RepID=A0A2N0QNV7_9GLOM|nr:hypothetical protein RhiirA1_480800 [Rhizophagus irregularis]
MDQDNILTPPAPQDNASTSSPPPVDTNASPSAPDSGTSLDDSQHAPSNSVDKGKSLRPLLSKDFGPTSKPIAKLVTRLTENSLPFPLMVVKLPLKGSGDTKIIVVYFRSKPDMEKAIAAPISSLHDLQFHEHDPSAKKVDEQLHTLVVTDIPLFVTDAQLRALSPVMVLLPTAVRVF